MERQTKGNTVSPFLNFIEAGDKNVGVGIYKKQIMAMLSWFPEWPKRGRKGCGGGPEIFPFHSLHRGSPIGFSPDELEHALGHTD